MARLGLDVAALVKLGKDARAETVLARLLAEGVSTRWAMRDGRAPTGASVLVSSHDRNAAIFTFRGANTLLEEADLRKEAFATDLVYVSSLSNDSADAFPAIVAGAKAQGALVADQPARAPAVLAQPAHSTTRWRISTFSPSIAARPTRSCRASSPVSARAEPSCPPRPASSCRGLPCAGFPAAATI